MGACLLVGCVIVACCACVCVCTSDSVLSDKLPGDRLDERLGTALGLRIDLISAETAAASVPETSNHELVRYCHYLNFDFYLFILDDHKIV